MTESPATAGKFMTFRLANETYGVPILKVRELIGALDITRVPGASAHMRGVVNLRGKVVPVADLRLKLGIAASAAHEQAVIMVVHSARGPLGLLVDEMLEVVTLGPAQISAPTCIDPGAFDARLLLGISQHESRLVLLLDLDRVFPTPEAEARPS